MFHISALKGRSIYDSRGNPTVEVDLWLKDGSYGRASAPSGASTGSKEALELRDNSHNYCGKGVLNIVDTINNKLKKLLLNKKFKSQEDFDKLLIELDASDNKSNLGTNLTTPMSIAFAKAIAKSKGTRLFSSITNLYKKSIPTPILNIINGGAHANNMLDIQEFMIAPKKYNSIQENLRIACEVFHNLKQILKEKGHNVNVGDEGGLAPELKSNRHALDLLYEAVEKSGYHCGKDVFFALDIAANELYDGKTYKFNGENKLYKQPELLEYYKHLCDNYPIISIEDPFAEDDLEGWKSINNVLGQKIKIIGDDLFVTNKKYLKIGIDQKLANSILIKVNQIGTLTEALETIKLAKDNNFTTVISHRSGETEDTAISHLAVSTNSEYIKAGSICRTDRTSKYNELIRIEEQLDTEEI